MHKFIFLLIPIILHPFLSLKGQEVLNTQQVIQQTLMNNYNISIAKNVNAIDRNNVSYGNAGMLPTLDLAGNFNQNNNLRFEGTRSQVDSTISQSRTNVISSSYNLGAELNWVLFDGTRMFITYDKLKAINERSEWDSKTVIENMLSQSLIAYYTVLNEQSRLEILNDALALSRERLTIAEDKYNLGSFSRAEYLAAKVDFNTDNSSVLVQKSVVKEAMVQLNMIIGRDPKQDFVVQDSIISVSSYFEIERLREKLRSDNYQLISSRVGLMIASKEKDEIRSELLPQLSFQATSGFGGSQNPVGFFQSTNTSSLSYGITASWRIFDGFNRNRRIQNAIINEQNQEVGLNSLQNQLLGQLETQYVLYQNRLQLIKLEINNVEVAKENTKLALDRYKVGRSNSLELREAQLNAIQSAGRLLNALYEARIAEIEILKITGTTISEN